MQISKIHIFLALGAILLSGIVLACLRNASSGIAQIPPTSTATDSLPLTAPASTTQLQVAWLSYTNTKYNYTFQYPQNVIIQPIAEEERMPVEQSADIEGGGVEIKIWHKYANKENLEFPKNNILAALDLQSFAESLRKKEDIYNHTVPSKRVSALEETTFAGYKAYSITVTVNSDSHDISSKVIYFDGKNSRFVIKYLLNNDVSKHMIDSFQLGN